MNTAALVIGAWIGGYMLPELLAILSSRSDFRIPLPMNFVAGCAAALIAYGLHA